MKKANLLRWFTAGFLFLMLFLVPGFSASAADKEAPKVHADSIVVDRKTTDRTGSVTISMKITDESEIADAVVWIIGAGVFPDYGVGAYNPATGLWDFEVTPRYFGKQEIQFVRTADVYGNVKEVYNDASAKVPKGYTMSYVEYRDLSGGDFFVSAGAYGSESKKPAIDLGSLTVSKASPAYNETVSFRVKIADDSPIAYTYIDYAFAGGSLRTEGRYDSAAGVYVYPVTCYSYGKIEPIVLVAEDAWGNKKGYVDKSQSYYEAGFDSGQEAGSLSGANMVVRGGKGDIAPPVLDLSSFRVEKVYLKREETMIISFKASDKSGISCTYSDIWYGGAGGNSTATNFTYNSDTKRYEVLVSSSYFGMHQIYEIRLRDTAGNSVVYLDENSEMFQRNGFYPEEGYKKADLSLSTFYVGLENAKTGTFVSNSSMDRTTRLKVKELAEGSDIFKKLLPSGSNAKGFYDVQVTGKCEMSGEKTKVCFDVPEGFSKGDSLTIRHLLSSGKVQKQTVPVIDGKVCMDVSEFSPFMITVKKSKDKNQFEKKGLVYQVTGKKSVKAAGFSRKSAADLVIPDTVKSGTKTFKVTEVDEEAFAGDKKIKSLSLGINVNKIGKKAFYNCKKLKKITIRTKKLTSKKIGKNAFRGVPAGVILKTPKGKERSCLRLLKEKGLGK